MDTTPRQEITIHQALHQPILVMGGERNLVLMLGVIAGVFIFSLAQTSSAKPGVASNPGSHAWSFRTSIQGMTDLPP